MDVLAPAVGNRHGMLPIMLQASGKKRLDLTRIREIKSACQNFLTLHGGSVTEDNHLQSAIAAGITIIHINTELRVAWRQSLEQSLAQKPHEIAPYKLLPAVEHAVAQGFLARLRLFNQQRKG